MSRSNRLPAIGCVVGLGAAALAVLGFATGNIRVSVGFGRIDFRNQAKLNATAQHIQSDYAAFPVNEATGNRVLQCDGNKLTVGTNYIQLTNGIINIDSWRGRNSVQLDLKGKNWKARSTRGLSADEFYDALYAFHQCMEQAASPTRSF